MAESQPVQVKPVTEPRIDWENRGTETLKQFFTVLNGPYNRLAIASDHYVHSYQGDPPAGVSPSLDAQIKGIENYRQVPFLDEIMEHVVKSAADLTQQVENRLQVITALTPEKSHPTKRLNDAADISFGLLRKLLGTKDLYEFNSTAHELTGILDKELSYVRTGATSGQAASQEIDKISRKTADDFDEWWRTNYQDEHHETIPGIQQSFHSFADTAHTRGDVYRSSTNTVLQEIPENASGAVVNFISDFRQNLFPNPQK